MNNNEEIIEIDKFEFDKLTKRPKLDRIGKTTKSGLKHESINEFQKKNKLFVTKVSEDLDIEKKYNILKSKHEKYVEESKTKFQIQNAQLDELNEKNKYLQTRITQLLGKLEEKKQIESVCGICLENLIDGGKQIKSTKCGHLFCQNCLGEWMFKNKSCPSCRKYITKQDTFSLWL